MSDGWALVIVGSVVAIVLWRGLRPVDTDETTAWARRFDVDPILAGQGFVARRLRRGRAARSVGATVGIAVSSLPLILNLVDGGDASAGSELTGMAWILGAAVGATVAEVAVNQHPGRRAASLTTRSVDDYIDRRWITILCTLGGLAVTGSLTQTLWRRDDWDPWWTGAALGLTALTLAALGTRIVLRRRALAPDGPEHAIDEALRAGGIHHVIGPCLPIAANGMAYGLAPLLPNNLVVVVVYVVATGSIGWWIQVTRNERWSVRRHRAGIA